MSILRTSHVRYFVKKKDENNKIIEKRKVLDNININIEQGDFVAILGHNGSGKSTLAKHLNALLIPDEGNVYIDGKDSGQMEDLWSLRAACGMVFQNPDNQIVGVTVEEDVGFGPENLGVDHDEIWERVNTALDKVDMQKSRKKSPNHLSGGQKQRVAIAASLAMKPKCIVFDEPTAMLDPSGRKEVMNIIMQLNKAGGMTVILITHHMNEAVLADKVLVMDKGQVVSEGTPREVFSDVNKIKSLKLDMPQAMELAYGLYKKGKLKRYDILDIQEFVKEFTDMYSVKEFNSYQEKKINGLAEGIEDELKKEMESRLSDKAYKEGNELLKMENVSLVYEAGTSMQVKALDSISLSVHEGELVGIIGHTGSGKSSLIQTMNGLQKVSEGNIFYKGQNINDKQFNKKELHCNVGIVFQYPESQLFEETVLKDVMFGPMNKGMNEEEAKVVSVEALKLMGINEEVFCNAPFELSGGEKRRVAIAGVLAMKPDIVILDEPTAGLDPQTRNDLLCTLKMLNNEKGTTILIVSHSMEDMAKYVERLIVMNEGKVVFDGDKRSVFGNVEKLVEMGLNIPDITYIMMELKNRGYNVNDRVITVDEALKGMKLYD